MRFIRAIVVDPEVPGRLAIKEVPAPQAGSSEALIQVEATSLNRGEVQIAMGTTAGWRPGWDLAGTVVEQAADGSGPKTGSRVVGMLDEGGAWAEQVAVPTAKLAELPASVTFAQAATLPIAGTTALRAVEKGGLLLNKRVLITGSTGGVGLFTHQIARLNGAYIVGTARQAENESVVREAGADEVIIGDDLTLASAYGPYDLIIDSLGGKPLESILPMLAAGATCVLLGWSASPEATATIGLSKLIVTGGTSLTTLSYGGQLATHAQDLGRLVHMVAERQLRTPIAVEASWHEIGEVAERLLQRQFTGKAVLYIG